MEAQEPADPAGHKAETEREVSEQDFLESTDAPSICPACGEPLPDSTNDDPALAECPTCGVEFFPAADEEDSGAEVRGDADEDAERDRDLELSAVRIRQVATLRRSLIRTRSYFLVGAMCCLGGGVQLIWLLLQLFARMHQVRATGTAMPSVLYAKAGTFVFALLAVCLGCAFFVRRVREMDRELAKPIQTDPETPPDFSTLSDGSQQARALEQMQSQII